MQRICGIWTCSRPFMTSSFHRTASVNQQNSLITVEKFKAVTVLSINRPDKQNAMNEAVLRELASHLTQFEEDSNSLAVIINGIGGNFSVGYDIDELKQKAQIDANAIRSSIHFPFQRKSWKPFLCSISGQCKAVGFEIALMCDVRYVEGKSSLGFSNRNFGLPLLNEGPKRLANIIGASKAIDFLMMDRQMNAEEAVELGIANGMVQDGTALGSAMKTAVYLTSFPEAALRYDIANLCGMNLSKDTDIWTSIFNDVKTKINLNENSLKSERVAKLNKMAQWEIDEIEHEQNYIRKSQQSDKKAE